MFCTHTSPQGVCMTLSHIRKACQSIKTDTLTRLPSDNSVIYDFFFFLEIDFTAIFSFVFDAVSASYTIPANFSAPLVVG